MLSEFYTNRSTDFRVTETQDGGRMFHYKWRHAAPSRISREKDASKQRTTVFHKEEIRMKRDTCSACAETHKLFVLPVFLVPANGAAL